MSLKSSKNSEVKQENKLALSTKLFDLIEEVNNKFQNDLRQNEILSQ